MAFWKKAFGVMKDLYNTFSIVHEELPSYYRGSINGDRERRYLEEKGIIKPDIPGRVSIIDHAFKRNLSQLQAFFLL